MANVISWIMLNWQNMVLAIQGLLTALIVVFALIPGNQPEKFLQSVVDFIAKFSIKK